MARIRLELPEHFPFSTRIEVRVTDVNYGGHVGNDTMLSFVHEARVRFFRSHGFTELDVGGAGIIMTDAALVFRGESFVGDVLNVEVAAGEPSRSGCDLYYRLTREDDDTTPILDAKTGIVFFDYERRKTVRMPEAFKKVFA